MTHCISSLCFHNVFVSEIHSQRETKEKCHSEFRHNVDGGGDC